ncbi:hypothetical protein [Streptomyces sp. WZ-12]|uniref:hypothetical protein n=1 Tax=Streptomyces sp. WZ-12 TaxID=3030210 RepID=UPI0023814B3A|nr:hypothetical protein [Streptomyces sp. WZ-12]
MRAAVKDELLPATARRPPGRPARAEAASDSAEAARAQVQPGVTVLALDRRAAPQGCLAVGRPRIEVWAAARAPVPELGALVLLRLAWVSSGPVAWAPLGERR